VLKQTNSWIDNNNVSFTQWRIYIKNTDNVPICYFTACVSPPDLIFSDLWNLDTIHDGEFGHLQSLYWLNLRYNNKFTAGFTVQGSSDATVPKFATGNFRKCQKYVA